MTAALATQPQTAQPAAAAARCLACRCLCRARRWAQHRQAQLLPLCCQPPRRCRHTCSCGVRGPCMTALPGMASLLAQRQSLLVPARCQRASRHAPGRRWWLSCRAEVHHGELVWKKVPVLRLWCQQLRMGLTVKRPVALPAVQSACPCPNSLLCAAPPRPLQATVCRRHLVAAQADAVGAAHLAPPPPRVCQHCVCQHCGRFRSRLPANLS